MTPSRRDFLLLCAAAAACGRGGTSAALGAQVFAAASLTDALSALGERAVREGQAAPSFQFEATALLARQIEHGAHADLFVSADATWMDYLEAHDLILRASRTDLLTNRLALIAPGRAPLSLTIEPGMALSAALGPEGRLALADPSSAPAGRYARAALERLGVWDSVADRVIIAQNVRAALRLVEMGEAEAGVVYRSDAVAAGARVALSGLFPESSHPRIVFPMAIVTGGNTAPAEAFAAFLRGAAARDVFERYGFGMA